MLYDRRYVICTFPGSNNCTGYNPANMNNYYPGNDKYITRIAAYNFFTYVYSTFPMMT